MKVEKQSVDPDIPQPVHELIAEYKTVFESTSDERP